MDNKLFMHTHFITELEFSLIIFEKVLFNEIQPFWLLNLLNFPSFWWMAEKSYFSSLIPNMYAYITIYFDN